MNVMRCMCSQPFIAELVFALALQRECGSQTNSFLHFDTKYDVSFYVNTNSTRFSAQVIL